MQVTYLEAYLGLDRRKFQAAGIGSFVAWLRQIAEDNLRDAIKELQRAKRPPADRRIAPKAGQESLVALVDLLGYTSTTPSRDAARGEASEFMENALRKLPPDHAKVVRMYDLDGCSPAEVAAAMGRSEGAMYMLRARAHDRLKSLLGSSSQFFTQAS
jgi:RNA polymerase sigma factor (sigma-70 family)